MRKIKILMCPANREPYITNISDSLTNMQKAVGGFIETYTLSTDAVIICNELRRIHGLPVNHSAPIDGFCGDVFVCSTNGEEFCSLKDETAKFLLEQGRHRFCRWKAGTK